MAPQTGHIGINVTDLDRSEQFYSEVLDLQRLGASHADSRRFVFLGRGDNVVLTLWEQSEGRYDSTAPGLHHLSFGVSTFAELEAAEKRLKSSGVAFVYDGIVPHAEGSPAEAIYFQDPDGLRLEIFTPAGSGGRKAPSGEAPSCGFF